MDKIAVLLPSLLVLTMAGVNLWFAWQNYRTSVMQRDLAERLRTVAKRMEGHMDDHFQGRPAHDQSKETLH